MQLAAATSRGPASGGSRVPSWRWSAACAGVHSVTAHRARRESCNERDHPTLVAGELIASRGLRRENRYGTVLLGRVRANPVETTAS